MAEWDNGNADATWLGDLDDGQVKEYGLGWVSRPRDPADPRRVAEITWSDDVEERGQLLAKIRLWVGRMREQLASSDALPLPLPGRWDGLWVTSSSLQVESLAAVREIGLAVLYRSPLASDRREQNQVTWVVRQGGTTSRETVVTQLTDWLDELQRQV